MSVVAQAAPTTRWRPSAFIAGSIALHAAALVVVLLADEWVWWALGAVVANQVVLTALGMWPRSTLLGPNFNRLPPAAQARSEIALTFDDGPDPDVTPRVLDLLDAHGVRATFFGISTLAGRHPEVVREIVRRGHAVENHSCGHLVTFSMMGMGGIRREIAQAQHTLSSLAGRAPRFFRPPAGLRNPLLDPVLHEMGLRLVSWTRRGFDTRQDDADQVAGRLLDGLAAGDILLLHDGHSARTASGTPVVLEVLPRLLDAARAKGLRFVTLGQAIDP
jgi:peptidoglycan/xylan/chitin deacetylase (PgdA/CDA1 family)